jgi:hypothetical protein
VPNGINKNIVRLAMTAAVYRARFHIWPTHARFAPIILWDLAQILDLENFEKLARLMELRTQPHGISVGGAPGVQRYEDVDHGRIPDGAREEAWRWLGLSTRPELGYYGVPGCP